MSMLRELIKYSKHPEMIFPRLGTKLLSPLNYFFARIWFKLQGRDKLRKGRHIFLFGGFGGRRYDDNSAAIFEYMLYNQIEIDSYWVIRKSCFFDKTNERQMPDNNRIVFKDSFQANILALAADAYIYSHGRYDITDYKRNDTPFAANIMLDHGFTALKREAKFKSSSGSKYGKGGVVGLDLITASSANEAEIHNREWGIPKEKIAVTGMARLDRLHSLKNTIQPTGVNILYMPTWREWNSRKISLTGSDFFRQIKSFLVDSGLDEYLYKKGIHLQFYVHMWMREFFEDFRKNFSLKSIEILDQGVDLQKVLLRSSLLVTDYSSICWDFLFLDRPVLFYQFDLDKYLRHTGSYIDLEKDLFGPVAHQAGEAVSWVKYFVETGFSTSLFQQKMEENKDFAFAYRDGKNCERMTQAILEHLHVNNIEFPQRRI